MTSRKTPRALVVVIGLAAAVTLVTIAACQQRGVLVRLFGPPTVQMEETYAEDTGSLVFDHSTFDAILKQHVRDGGLVDYAGIGTDSEGLDRYLKALEDAPFKDLGRDEKLALLINAYNAFTIRLILDHQPLASIRDIPGDQRWDARRWRLAGQTYSLTELEHEQVRPHFKEPRVHFALVCAAIGCPPLRAEAYTGAQIDEQLEEQARYVHAHDRWFRFDPAASAVKLTPLYEWYQGDFEQAGGTILEFAARHAPGLQQALRDGADPSIEFLDYDWALNQIDSRP